MQWLAHSRHYVSVVLCIIMMIIFYTYQWLPRSDKLKFVLHHSLLYLGLMSAFSKNLPTQSMVLIRSFYTNLRQSASWIHYQFGNIFFGVQGEGIQSWYSGPPEQCVWSQLLQNSGMPTSPHDLCINKVRLCS